MVTYSPNSFFERGRGSIYKSPPKSKPTSKPKNANQQAAQSMLSVGIGGISGKTTTSSAQKIQDRFREETQKDSGSTKGLGAKPNITMEEVDTPNALTKKEKIYEALMAASAAVGLSAPQPTKAYTYNPMKVYTSEMVRPQGLVAYDAMFPTDATLNAANPPYSKTVGGNQQPLYTPDTRGFGQSVDNRALFERLDDPFRLGQGTDTTPNMGGEITNPNMDRITPTIPNPVIPESPSGVDPVSRAISQAMLPTEVNYTIQDGDTLSEIAREAGTTVEELKELNNIEDIDIIDAGSNLKVPVGSAKLTDTQAALRRGLGSKKDNKGIKVAGGTMEELAKLLRAYTDEMGDKITTDPDSEFYDSFRQGVTVEGSEEQRLFDALVGGESVDFDTVYNRAKVKPSKPITQMTVKEVQDWQQANIDAGSASTAAGRFQIISPNMKYLLDKKIIKKDDVFDADTQMKAYDGLLEKRGYSDFKEDINKATTKKEKQKVAENFLVKLAKEYASVPIPVDIPDRINPETGEGLKKGDSYYEGRSGNTTKNNPKSVEDYLEILEDFSRIGTDK